VTTAVAVALALLALCGAFVWLVGKPRRDRHTNPVEDPDALAKAERELEDLDVLMDPDEADEHLPDWGPGAPGA
jgi:beta-lactam-binding protein with PASTA domain